MCEDDDGQVKVKAIAHEKKSGNDIVMHSYQVQTTGRLITVDLIY